MQTVPVLIKSPGNLWHDWSDCQHIDVGKSEILIRIEILITNISAAYYGCLVVNRERFGVHSKINIGQPSDELQVLRNSANKWVEQPDLLVGVGSSVVQILSASSPYISSISMRTPTPRSAALIRLRMSSWPTVS